MPEPSASRTHHVVIDRLSAAAGFPVPIAPRRRDPWKTQRYPEWATSPCRTFTNVMIKDGQILMLTKPCRSWACPDCAPDEMGTVIGHLKTHVEESPIHLAVVSQEAWDNVGAKRAERAGGEHLLVVLTDRVVVLADQDWLDKSPAPDFVASLPITTTKALLGNQGTKSSPGQTRSRGRPRRAIAAAGCWVTPAEAGNYLMDVAQALVVTSRHWSDGWLPPKREASGWKTARSSTSRTARRAGELLPEPWLTTNGRLWKGGEDPELAGVEALDRARRQLCVGCGNPAWERQLVVVLHEVYHRSCWSKVPCVRCGQGNIDAAEAVGRPMHQRCADAEVERYLAEAEAEREVNVARWEAAVEAAALVTSDYLVPNPTARKRAVRQALAEAGVEDPVESEVTWTLVTDALEAIGARWDHGARRWRWRPPRRCDRCNRPILVGIEHACVGT